MTVSGGTRGQVGTCRASLGAGTQNSDTIGHTMPLYLAQVKSQGNTFLISTLLVEGFPGGSAVKNPPANAGDAGSAPWSERSPGEGNGNPLENSCLENPMDRGRHPDGYSPWGRRRVGHNLVTKQLPGDRAKAAGRGRGAELGQ